jgi:hypothetical protein
MVAISRCLLSRYSLRIEPPSIPRDDFVVTIDVPMKRSRESWYIMICLLINKWTDGSYPLLLAPTRSVMMGRTLAAQRPIPSHPMLSSC